LYFCIVSDGFLRGGKALKIYIKEISKYKVLSHEEQKKLLAKAQGGDTKARNRLIETNLKFVVMVAKEYYIGEMPLGDLISAGNAGLITAINKWDVKHGVTFLTYGVWWIRSTIQKFIREEGFVVRKPDNVLKTRSAIQKERDDLEKKTGYAPDSIVADNLGIDELAVIGNDTVSKNQFLPEIRDDGSSVFDDIDSGDRADKNDDLNKEINKLLNRLKPEERQVLELYFGLNGKDALPLPAIAEKLGQTPQNVSYRMKKGLDRLKKNKRLLEKLRNFH